MRSPIEQYLTRVHQQCQQLREGTPSAATPELSRGNPNSYGIAIATVDGHVYEIGDTDEEFTIQSISKAFTYAQALTDLGAEAVDELIDVEPSGDAFNEISLQANGRPDNALINAGAIATTSLVLQEKGVLQGDGALQNNSPNDPPRAVPGRAARLLDTYGRFAGRSLRVNEASHAQESEFGDRNRAMGYLMKSFGIMTGDIEQALDDYFFQCSIQVNCRDLAVMAATLANNGTNPLTGDEVISPDVDGRVLSVMSTCGMYDDSGHWMTEVGLPAKSGVGGGIIAVLPGQMGLAVYSPPLDEHGNSVRGVETCKRLSRDLQLHFAHATTAARSSVRGIGPITDSPTLLRRNDAAQEVLEAHGGRALVIELQGDLMFAGVDAALRAIQDACSDETEIAIVDLRRVNDVAEVSTYLFARLQQSFSEDGKSLLLVDPDNRLGGGSGRRPDGLAIHASRTHAIQWAEDRIIDHYGGPECRPAEHNLAGSQLAEHLTDSDVAQLRGRVSRHHAPAGAVVLAPGQEFAGIHFILSGRVMQAIGDVSTVERPDYDTERFTDATDTRDTDDGFIDISQLTAGMTFGEGALGFGRQVLRVTAETDLEYLLLPAAQLAALEDEDPQFAMRIWRAIAREGYRQVGHQLRDIGLRATQLQ